MPTISSELYSVDTLQILPAEDAFVQGHFLMPEENGQVQTYSEIPGQEYGDQWNASRVNWWITALAILLVILYLRRFTSILPQISRGALRWREIISMEGNMRLCRERDSVAAAALLISFVCVSRLDLLPAEFLAALTPGWKTLASAGVIVGFLILRQICTVCAPSGKIRQDTKRISEGCAANFFILGVSLLLFLLILYSLSDTLAVFAHDAAYWVILAVWLVFLMRKYQIIATDDGRFTAILYLCTIELIPAVILAATMMYL